MTGRLPIRLRASGIARRSGEEERAEVFFLGERRRTRRLQSAMREQAQIIGPTDSQNGPSEAKLPG
jgi:hypothetical protein